MKGIRKPHLLLLIFSLVVFSAFPFKAFAVSDPFDRPVGLVIVDAGHGGYDPGAGGNGLVEKDVVLDIALLLEEELVAEGFQVIMTRRDDTFISLQDRSLTGRTAAYGLDKSAVFVSIHANSSSTASAGGFEVFTAFDDKVIDFLNADSPFENGFRFGAFTSVQASAMWAEASDELCTSILSSMEEAFSDMRNRGAKEDELYVLNCSALPAVLVEVGFISNPAEAARLGSRSFRKQMAGAIARGIVEYSEGR